jgi:hypothetical protein
MALRPYMGGLERIVPEAKDVPKEAPKGVKEL